MLTTLPANTRFLKYQHEYVVLFKKDKPVPLGYIILEYDENEQVKMRVTDVLEEGAIPFYVDMRLRETLSTLIRTRVKLDGVVDIKVDSSFRATHAVLKVKAIFFT